MVQINFAQKEIQCKIVYYGPGMSGKTTNLEVVHGKVPEDSRGELTSIATTGERTLYFDYMPLDLGQIAGIRTKFQLYTVPGQIYYKSTRRLVLQGVDGIVFVADSSADKMRENKESLADLEENLKEMGKSLKDVPIVIQYNKRDLPNALSLEDLEQEVNPYGFPHFAAVATQGEGVFPTLKALAGRVLETVNQGSLSQSRPNPVPRRAKPSPTRARTPAPVPVAAAATATVPGTATARSMPVAPPPRGNFPTARPPAAAAVPPVAAPPPPMPPPAMPTGMPRADIPVVPVATQHPLTQSGSIPSPAFDSGRTFEDRMVKVSGLRGTENPARIPIIVSLFALIAGAIFLALSELM